MVGDVDIPCLVMRTVHFGLAKRISFAASREGRVRRQTLNGWHGMGLTTWELHVRPGQRIRLWYPFWKSFHVGDQVALSEIAFHPFAPVKFAGRQRA